MLGNNSSDDGVVNMVKGANPDNYKIFFNVWS